jgi:hypothetical protein
MAHDVEFYDNNTNETIGFFFGLAEAIWYKLLDADHYYGGCSGNGKTVFKTAREMENVLTVMETFKALQSYPDPNRLVELKYNTISDAAAEFGSLVAIRDTFIGFQKYLYE